MTRKTARDKLPGEPRKLRPPYTDQPLPFTSEDVAVEVRKQRRAQGLSDVSERPWQ